MAENFQSRVKPWMDACFGPAISADRIERNHRFIEEALELVQSNGCTASEAHQLVDYVYSRAEGERPQEIGGVMVTLAALCLATGDDMHQCGEIELARVWTKVEQIRAKQAAKPKHGPLPQEWNRRSSPPAVEGGWREIATAPKDGTRFLLFFPSLYSSGSVICGHWDDDRYAMKPRPFWTCDKERFVGKVSLRANPPTHWKPLDAPTPPAGEKPE